MKKLIASLLCVVMVCAMVACGSDEKSSTPAAPSTEAPKTEATVAPETDAPSTEATVAPETEAPKTEADASNDNLADKLVNEFKTLIADSDDITAIAEKLSAEEFCGYNCGTMEVAEGFLNGFDEEIKGFKKGVMFMPMIGSIPFVGYIFESDDPEGFLEVLKSKANPRWNVCTEAKETGFVAVDGYVFFTMCPGPMEEF